MIKKTAHVGVKLCVDTRQVRVFVPYTSQYDVEFLTVSFSSIVIRSLAVPRKDKLDQCQQSIQW